MTSPSHLGPGSCLPLWIESLERTCFGETWGALEEDEHLWLLPSQAYARWRVTPVIGEAELLRIGVAPDLRHRGLGRNLLRHCQAVLRELGCDTLHLEVRVSNAAARHLYEAEGWKEVGLRPKYYRDGEDAALYSFTAS